MKFLYSPFMRLRSVFNERSPIMAGELGSGTTDRSAPAFLPPSLPPSHLPVSVAATATSNSERVSGLSLLLFSLVSSPFGRHVRNCSCGLASLRHPAQ